VLLFKIKYIVKSNHKKVSLYSNKIKVKLYSMKKYYTLLFICLLCFPIVQAQEIFINEQDDSTTIYELDDVRRITFENNEFVLLLFDGNEFSFSLGSIANYRYNDDVFSTENFLHQANNWGLNIYPNPSTSMVNVSFNLVDPMYIYYTITDMQGKLLIKKDLSYVTQGSNIFSISMSDLASGVYLFKMQGQDVSISSKIIKQ